jgi:1,5-anhydro-D-fructose reductase (1,5-anhydro-D-mannitol-forming)
MFAAPPPPPNPASHSLLAPSSIGWGIIGASTVAGNRMVDAIRSQPPLISKENRQALTNAWIVGVFSHNEHLARDFAEKHRLPHAFTNLDDLLRHPQIQSVYIGGYPRHRAQATMAALAAGKHVLCEPPLALDIETALNLQQAAAANGLILAVNHVRRATPAIQQIHHFIAAGAIGEVAGGSIMNTVLLPTPHHTWRLRPSGGGVLLDRTIHTLDSLRYLLRDDVDQVFCSEGKKVLGDSVEEEVLGHIILRRTKLIFQFHDSYLLPHLPTRLELTGSNGALVAHHLFVDNMPDELYLFRHGHVTQVPLQPVNPFIVSVTRFLEAVRQEGSPLATGLDGIASLRATLAAAASLRVGHAIHLPV